MNKKGLTLVELMVGVVIVLVAGGMLFGGCYGVMNAKTVTGTVQSIENLTPGMVANNNSGSVEYSFAVSIDVGDEIFSFSATDRQWATVKVGEVVKAKAFPYVPWNFQKAGTFHGGRLIKKLKR